MGLCLTGLWTRSTSRWLPVHLVLRTRYILDIQDMIFYVSYFGKGLCQGDMPGMLDVVCLCGSTQL